MRVTRRTSGRSGPGGVVKEQRSVAKQMKELVVKVIRVLKDKGMMKGT